MRVATWRGSDRFTIDEAPEPVVKPGWVVVDVHAAGICGTDIHATQGLFPWTPPLVMGHEYTGVVREVGRGVSKSLVGKTVELDGLRIDASTFPIELSLASWSTNEGTFFTAVIPNRIESPSSVKPGRLRFTSGGRTSIPDLRASSTSVTMRSVSPTSLVSAAAR